MLDLRNERTGRWKPRGSRKLTGRSSDRRHRGGVRRPPRNPEFGSWILGRGRTVSHSNSELHDEGSVEAFRPMTTATCGYLPSPSLDELVCFEVGSRKSEVGSLGEACGYHLPTQVDFLGSEVGIRMSEVRFGKASFESIDSNEALLKCRSSCRPAKTHSCLRRLLASRVPSPLLLLVWLAPALRLRPSRGFAVFLAPSSAALDR